MVSVYSIIVIFCWHHNCCCAIFLHNTKCLSIFYSTKEIIKVFFPLLQSVDFHRLCKKLMYIDIGVTGFEPATSASQKQRSTKLSYTPRSGKGGIRTHGCFHIAGFQDQSHQPLDHLSLLYFKVKFPDFSFSSFFLIYQVF